MKLRPQIGVDLGTATILIARVGQGVLLQEPSVVAVQKRSRKIVAVGQDAQDMLGRTPESIEAIRPLREGVISDFEATEALLKTFLARTLKGLFWRIFKPTVVVCIPSVITPVERRAVEDACHQLGLGEVILIHEPVAAAMGADLPIDEPKGHLVVDIGGGTTDISVLSLGAPVVDATLRVAGDVFDESIQRHLRRELNLVIGEKTAEELKRKYGTALPPEEPAVITVRGRNLLNGLPGEVTFSQDLLYEALREPITHILEGIQQVLQQTPPELLADLAETGILLTGGGALIQDLAACIEAAIGLQARVAEEPVSCVVRGTLAAFEHLDRLRELQEG